MGAAGRVFSLTTALAVITIITVCQASGQVSVLKSFPINDLKGVLTKSGVYFDKKISSDGEGSLRIEASGPTTVKLFKVSDVDVEDARLIYQARIRTRNLSGKAYLEMWCRFPDRGKYFSRGLNNPLSGTVDWTTTQTPFFLQKGQKPDLIKLNVVIKGTGTVWIDNISLVKGPLM